MSGDRPGRWPDFVVIGAGKSGTTTLARWLDQQPDVLISDPKEPRFFSHAERWDRGADWYRSLFADAGPEAVAGEASTAYADPSTAATASRRMADLLPDVRLVYLVRHPIERVRSQYRYHVARGLEPLPLAKAVRVPGNRHVGRSLYHACASPFLEHHPRERLAVVRFEDLVTPGGPGWGQVLDHLGLAPRPAPVSAHNVTADRRHHPSALLRLGLRAGIGGRVPRVLRPASDRLRRAIRRPGPAAAGVLARSEGPLPQDVLDLIWADVAAFEALVGTGPLWERSDETD